MKTLLAAIAVLGALGISAAVQAEQPPLVDRNLFFGEVDILSMKVSPDGKYLAFLKPYNGARNLWVKKIDEPFDAAKPVSNESSRPIPQYSWSRDSKFLLYVQDAGGDENFNLYAIDPKAAPDPKSGVPPTRALTNLKKVRTTLVDLPRSRPDIAYIGLNDRDPQWHDLYELQLSTGKMTLLRKNTEQIASWDFDHNAKLRLATRTNQAGDTEILRVDPSGFQKIYDCTVFEQCQVVDFTADNKAAYLVTNKGQLDLSELDALDLKSGAAKKLEGDPRGKVDFGSLHLSDKDHHILFTEYEDDFLRQNFKDAKFEQEYKWLQAKLPNRSLHLGTSSADEKLWIVEASSDVEPGETYVWNRSAQTLTFQFRVRDKLPREALSQQKAIHYPSSDGLDIGAYLTLPKGLDNKNLPLIVFPHGGPWGRESWGYGGFAQFFANRGYAVLQPNFRASVGFGKKFLNAGNGEWGRKMQDDLTWGVKALVADGTIDPKRVGIAGGSYGGYATLAGVTYTPTLYRAAVDIVGPSNLSTLLQAIPPYWESMRKTLYARMGDPNTEAGKALLDAESPLFKAKDIVTPLMVVQGRNDPRVNIREAEQIVAAAYANGKSVEYLVAPDEGHGFRRPINNLAMAAAMERFLAAQLGGRYQEGMSDDVAAKLKELTVDPKTVGVAASASAPAAAQ